jgi:phosphoribosylformylglycinamidine cyclo-ligase
MGPAARPARGLGSVDQILSFAMSGSYESLGVDAQGVDETLRGLGGLIQETFSFNEYPPLLPLGYFANVVRLSVDLGLAISTDGVGTKLLIAQQMDKYDTVGIDCVAMNANDIICVGAKPVSMVDYIAVQRLDDRQLGQIAVGLRDGAKQAGINIPGGEIAQVREMIHGPRDGMGIDLVGSCVGVVHPERIVIGQDVKPGDAVVGIAAVGMHSNGFTLARHALFERGGLSVDTRVDELGRSVGEELLEPTPLYVRPIVELLESGLAIHALAHITGDGLLNLSRVAAPVGFVIDAPLPPLPIFSLIQRLAEVETSEMFSVFNMGTGFCVVLAADDADRAIRAATDHGHTARVIGYAVGDESRRVWLPEQGLVGEGKRFRSSTDAPPPRAE